MTTVTDTTTSRQTPLFERLAHALQSGPEELTALVGAEATDRRDRVTTLLRIYELHTAPLEKAGPPVRFQHHPAVAELKARLEADWLAELRRVQLPAELAGQDVVNAMRKLAARDRLPEVYQWLARSATYDEVVRFLALEGGPDAGFDDLVALCQVGLRDSAKLELGRNYWDEMGDGDPGEVHTTLYERMASSLGVPGLPLREQPVAGLERAALGGLLATNRWLQPEFVGALGMTELQAGPRCRLVLQAFDRLSVPEEAFAFYRVHADVDPRHGKDWLDNAVGPLAAEHPDWGPRMLTGALWRHHTNAAFFEGLTEEIAQPAAA